MTWRILIITKDYMKYVDYFKTYYNESHIFMFGSIFIDEHMCITILPNINTHIGSRFDFVYADKELIKKYHDDLIMTTRCQAIINIKHLERKLCLKGELE